MWRPAELRAQSQPVASPSNGLSWMSSAAHKRRDLLLWELQSALTTVWSCFGAGVTCTGAWQQAELCRRLR